MEELLNAWQTSKVDQKIDLLLQVLQFGEAGIDFLISKLSDRELLVRAKTYQLLQNISSLKVQQAIAPGLLFNPGDNIYCVYESVMQYNDNWWYVINSFYDILFYSNWECTAFVSFHLDRESAEQAAYEFHKREVSTQHDICFHDINDVGTNDDTFRKDFEYIYDWCKAHNIPVRVPDKNSGEYDPINYNRLALSLEECVNESLMKDREYDLLAQLWLDAVGSLAFVQPMVVQETTYLKLEDNI